jgi:hypothetical protein
LLTPALDSGKRGHPGSRMNMLAALVEETSVIAMYLRIIVMSRTEPEA